jgi:hypothetical protein
MKTVTSYRLVSGEVVKSPVSEMARESYAAISEKPMSQRVLDAYYSLECQQKPLGIKNASRVKAIHMAALAEGR